MSDFLSNPFIISSIVIFGSVAYSYVRDSLKSKGSKINGGINEFGVPETMQVDWLDTDDRAKKYDHVCEHLHKKYAKEDDYDNLWVQMLPEDDKESLKFLLMARIVVALHIYEKVEEETQAMQKLYNVNVCSVQYWESCLTVLKYCKDDLEYLKQEMILIEPDVQAQQVFGEGWQILSKFGPEWPRNMQKKCPPDCQCETSVRERNEEEAKKKAIAAASSPEEAEEISQVLIEAAKAGHNLTVEQAKECLANAKKLGASPEELEEIAQVMAQAQAAGHRLTPEQAKNLIAESKQAKVLGPFGTLKENGFTWRQTPPPNEVVEIMIELPTETERSQVEVDFTIDSMKLSYDGHELVKWTFKNNIIPSECKWDVADDVPKVEDGDECILSGLSNDEFNGLKGEILSTPAETREKGRWRVVLTDKRELAIKEENIVVQSAKGRIVLKLVKEESKPWPNPAWK